MKRIFSFLLYALLPLAVMAQATRPVRGVVFDNNGIPMAGAKLVAIGSTDSTLSGADGTFEMMVSPYTKLIEASKEGFISAQAEVDGSYLVFKLQVDKKYAENKAKAEEEARKAAEAEKARLAAEAEAQRLAAEKAEQERRAAEARAKAEEEKRIAAEKAAAEKAEQARIAAEEKKRLEEERRIAAERAAAERAEKAEQARIAAEKAAAEKAEKARLAAEAKAKAEEEKRLAAEKAAAEKAEAARQLAEAKRQAAITANNQNEASRLNKQEQAASLKAANLVKRQENISKWQQAKLRGYGSIVDVSWGIDSYSLMMSGGLHYIGGYHFNNCIYLGAGTGINLSQTYSRQPNENALSSNAWDVPLFAHLRTNFINRRCSPFFAISAGYQFSTKRELPMPFEQSVKYKTSGVFVNPQLGVNIRLNPKHAIYVAAGATLFQRPYLVELTSTTATFGSQLGWDIDLHIGFTF